MRRFVPLLTWLPSYDRGWLRFDLIAGATIWGLLVPEMIAYAGLAGLPPQAGLYTLLVTLGAYAIFGTSRHVVAAGTSAAAVLVASGSPIVARSIRPSTQHSPPGSCFCAVCCSWGPGFCASASSHSSCRSP